MQQALVDQQAIGKIAVKDAPEPALEPGQARLRVESFALTANNVTYATSGFAIGYWRFYPSGIDGQGIVPVWGCAEVVESLSDALTPGTRLYGFLPMAETCVITPKQAGDRAIIDISAHRADLPAFYNSYAVLKGPGGEGDHMRSLLQPLLATSYLLCDWLIDNNCFGAAQIIIGSASSKTGLGLAKFLNERAARSFKIIGLTSEGNRDFVEKSKACDVVFAYAELSKIAQVPSVYVDMAGNSEVKAALHAHLGDNMKHSAAVGLSHWDKFQPKTPLQGPKPVFFFAPAQAAKRQQEWGPGVIEAEITKAWKRIAADAQDWLTLTPHEGLNGAIEVYREIAKGDANPREGHIVRL